MLQCPHLTLTNSYTMLLLLDRVHINRVYCRLFERKLVQCTIYHSGLISNTFMFKYVLFIFGYI